MPEKTLATKWTGNGKGKGKGKGGKGKICKGKSGKGRKGKGKGKGKGKAGKAGVGRDSTTSLLADALPGTGFNGDIDDYSTKQSAEHADEKATTLGLSAAVLTDAVVKKEEARTEAVTEDEATTEDVNKYVGYEDVKEERDEDDGSMEYEWLDEPPDVKFGCSKCRFTELGCGRCRVKAGWYFSRGRGWRCTREADE
jgi:hypothetical protein